MTGQGCREFSIWWVVRPRMISIAAVIRKTSYVFLPRAINRSCVGNGTKAFRRWMGPPHEFSVSGGLLLRRSILLWACEARPVDPRFRGCKRDIHHGSSGTAKGSARFCGLAREAREAARPAMPWSAPLMCFNFLLRAHQHPKVLHDEHGRLSALQRWMTSVKLRVKRLVMFLVRRSADTSVPLTRMLECIIFWKMKLKLGLF